MRTIFFVIHLIFVVVSCRKQRYLFYYIAFYFFSSALMDVSELISVGGIQIIGRDMLLLGMISYTICHKGVRLYKNRTSYILLFLILFAVVRICVGYLNYGFNTRLISAIRSYGHYLGMIFCLYAMKDELDFAAVKRVSYISFNILGAYLGIYYILAYGANIVLRGNVKLYRPVSAIYALCLAFYCLYLLNKDLKTAQNRLSLRTLYFFVVTILCRHNSVWIALAMGCIVLIYCHKDVVFHNRKRMQQGALLIGIVVLLLVVFKDTSIIKGLTVSMGKFNSETTEYDTLGTRIDIWISALNSFDGIEWIIGQGVGGSSRIIYLGKTWENQLHNTYVQILMELGWMGVIPFVFLLLGNVPRCIKESCWEGAAMLVAILSYWLSYGYSIEQAIIIGMILNYIYSYRKGKVEKILITET